MSDILITLAILAILGFMLAWPTFLERVHPFLSRLLTGSSPDTGDSERHGDPFDKSSAA